MPTSKLLLLISILIPSCAVQQSKPAPLPLIFQEQNWESLFIPNGQGEKVEFQVKLSPQNRSAVAWCPKTRHQIHLDFTTQLPDFQPTLVHTVGVAEQVLFVSGYDSNNGEGMLVQLIPTFEQGERIECRLLYRGDCFSIARDMLVLEEDGSEIYILDQSGSLLLLHPKNDTRQTLIAAKDSELLSRCHFLELANVSDLQGNFSFAIRATENKHFNGCIPNLPLGANVVLEQDAETGRFTVFMESDYKTDPFQSLTYPRE